MHLEEQLLVCVDGIPGLKPAIDALREILINQVTGNEPITHRTLDHVLGLLLTESYDGESPRYLGQWVEAYQTEHLYPVLEDILEKAEWIDNFYTLVNFIPCTRLHQVMIVLTEPIKSGKESIE